LKKYLFHRLKKNERGASLIEFALVAPLLIFLVMGIVEFGWIFNGYVTLNGAVREGARIASIKKDLDDTGYITEVVEAHVTNTLFNISVKDPEEVLISGGGKNYGVKIAADGDIEPLIGFYVKNTITLSAETTMRMQ